MTFCAEMEMASYQNEKRKRGSYPSGGGGRGRRRGAFPHPHTITIVKRRKGMEKGMQGGWRGFEAGAEQPVRWQKSAVDKKNPCLVWEVSRGCIS